MLFLFSNNPKSEFFPTILSCFSRKSFVKWHLLIKVDTIRHDHFKGNRGKNEAGE